MSLNRRHRESPSRARLLPLPLFPLQRWDVDFGGNTRFYGRALPLHAYAGDTLYFASVFFICGPMGLRHGTISIFTGFDANPQGIVLTA